MAQFEENVTVDPTTMTISETKAVKKEPNATLATATDTTTLTKPEVRYES